MGEALGKARRTRSRRMQLLVCSIVQGYAGGGKEKEKNRFQIQQEPVRDLTMGAASRMARRARYRRLASV